MPAVSKCFTYFCFLNLFMQIFFNYDRKQVIQALRFHFIGRREVRLLLILVNVFAILSAIMFYSKKVSPFAFLISSLLWIALMVAFWFILPNTVYKKAATFQDAFKMTFSEVGVRLENERGYNMWQWNKFVYYLESPNFIHLYFDSKSFFLVPKEAIIKTASLDDLRLLLQEKIKRR